MLASRHAASNETRQVPAVTAAPEPPVPGPDDLVQMNVRVPRALRDAADQRRATVNGGISRDKWVARVMAWALSQPPPRAVPTGPGQRTAPPPHRR